MLRSNVQQFRNTTALGGPIHASPTCNAQIASGFGAPTLISFTLGMSIAEIAFQEYTNVDGVIAEIFNGELWERVPDHMWGAVRPKLSNVIRFLHPLSGGKNGGQIFALIATIALTTIVGPAGLGLGASFGAALGVSAGLGSAILMGVGGALIGYAGSKLFPPAIANFTTKQEQDASNFENVESDSNVLPLGGYLQWVAGERRVTLPELMPPFTYLKEGKLTLDRVFGCQGHHEIKDIEADDKPIAGNDKIQSQIRNGALSTPVETFVKKYTLPITLSQQFGKFSLDEKEIEDQDSPSNSEPEPIEFATQYRNKLEEISIRIQLSSFATNDNETQKVAFPLRIWFRPKGDTVWNGICELHILGRDAGQVLKDIRLRWNDDFEFESAQETASSKFSYKIFAKVPAAANALSDSSTGLQFDAHEHFKSGDDFTSSANIIAKNTGLRIVLDEGIFPKGEYEFKIESGLVTFAATIYEEENDQLNADYEIDGVVHSLFRSYKDAAVWKVPVSQSNYPAQVNVIMVNCIVGEQPVQKPGTGVLAIRSKQTIRRVTAVLGAMVNRYDGENFTDLGASSNPADQMFAYLQKGIRLFGVSDKVILENTLSEWHKECAARDYRISAIYNGQSFKTVRDSIAAAGFGRFIYDGGYGVDFLRDRSGERPKHTFSSRSSHQSFNVNVITRPESFRVTFPDRSNGWKMTELNVLSDHPSTYSGQLGLTLNNVDREIDVLRRIHFDDYSTQYQNVTHTIEGFKDAHEMEVGDLIGVANDLIGDHTHGFRIREVLGNNRVRVDQAIPSEIVNDIYTEGNLFDVANMFNLGTKTVIYFNAYDPVNDPEGDNFYMDSRFITNVDGEILTLDSPITEIDMGEGEKPFLQKPKIGSHVTVTPEVNSRFRCIVSEIVREADGHATITALPEEPKILQKIMELN